MSIGFGTANELDAAPQYYQVPLTIRKRISKLLLMSIHRWFAVCVLLLIPVAFGAKSEKEKKAAPEKPPTYSNELKTQLKGLSKSLYLHIAMNADAAQAGVKEKDIRDVLRREFKNNGIQMLETFHSPMVAIAINAKSLNETTGEFYTAAVTVQIVERMTSSDRGSNVYPLMASAWDRSAVVVFGKDKAPLNEVAKALVNAFSNDYSLANH